MKIRSKLILSAVAATLGCALLAGCGGAASSSTASSASPAASSVVLSQAESALPDDGTNSPDALADEVDALLEANAGRELDTASDVKPARTAGMLIAISLACTAAAAGAAFGLGAAGDSCAACSGCGSSPDRLNVSSNSSSYKSIVLLS